MEKKIVVAIEKGALGSLSTKDNLILWHINPCMSFNAKFFLYIILNIWFLNTFLDNIFKRVWAHFSHS